MEYFGSLFNNSNGSISNCVREPDGNCTTNHAWPCLDLGSNGTSRPNWSYPLPNSLNYPPPATASSLGVLHALMLHDHEKIASNYSCSSVTNTTTAASSLYVGREPQYLNADPYLTCLKLGKRHYFEDVASPVVGRAEGSFSVFKKGKPHVNATTSAAPVAVADSATAGVPRCQVEGCGAVLVNAKDYHRRHKVCEMHAKAPKVVVLGIEQRFCQQCSRFHALGEFDEAKRSCRRRLAGHNERRRKSSQGQNSLLKRNSQGKKMVGAGRQTQFLNNGECALSLLSPSHHTPWNLPTSPDLPARCSAALRELIEENRASILACRQLINANLEGYKLSSVRAGPNHEEGGGHVTLNLMQAPSSAFGLLSVHDHKSSKDEYEEECSELWKVPWGC